MSSTISYLTSTHHASPFLLVTLSRSQHVFFRIGSFFKILSTLLCKFISQFCLILPREASFVELNEGAELTSLLPPLLSLSSFLQNHEPQLKRLGALFESLALRVAVLETKDGGVPGGGESAEGTEGRGGALVEREVRPFSLPSSSHSSRDIG